MIVVVTYPKYFKLYWSKTIRIVWLFSRLFCGSISQLCKFENRSVSRFTKQFCLSKLYIYMYVCFLSNWYHWYHEVNGDFCCLMMEDSPTPLGLSLEAQTKEKAEGFDEVRFVWDAAAKCFWVCTGQSNPQTLQRWIEMSQFFIAHFVSESVFDVCFGFSEMEMMVSKFCESCKKTFGTTGGNVVKLHADAQGKEHLRKWILEAKSTTWLDGKDWGRRWMADWKKQLIYWVCCGANWKGKGLILFVSVIAIFENGMS